jgi:hypothetical protein
MDQVKLRALRHVRRFNFEHCNKYETVAEHSLFVALLAMDACRVLGLEPAQYIREALLHDAEEAVTGDIPYLVRRALQGAELASLDARAAGELGVEHEAVGRPEVVLYCDALELATYLREEVSSGNAALWQIYRETVGRLVRSQLWGPLSTWTSTILKTTADDLLTFQSEEHPHMKH